MHGLTSLPFLWGFILHKAGIKSKNNTMVSVAQLVESRIVIPVVVGSSPIIHPIYL